MGRKRKSPSADSPHIRPLGASSRLSCSQCLAPCWLRHRVYEQMNGCLGRVLGTGLSGHFPYECLRAGRGRNVAVLIYQIRKLRL